MYAIDHLKPLLSVSDTHVGCPVRGCPCEVRRQRNAFKTAPEYFCPEHRIYVSPSTFEYDDYRDNLLWTRPEDENLLSAIFEVKRESRMARDNSEDALTWNVFRFLEQSGLLAGWLEFLTGKSVANPRIIYWSYCQDKNNTWPLLADARAEFGEAAQRGSEPDIIIETDNAVFWIEAKFLSGNETVPSDPNNSKKYLTGGNRLFDRLFKSPFGKVAVEKKLYELSRFWLLGNWVAGQAGKQFYLVNLVRDQKEQFIEREFGSHISPGEGQHFSRASWEGIYQFVREAGAGHTDCGRILAYMKGKSSGYNALRQLQQAFSI